MENELYKLFPTCVIQDEALYCVTDCEHIFEKIDINNGNIEYLDDPKGFDFQKWSGTDSILIYGENLYFLEQNGEHIMKYILSENSVKYIDLRCNDYFCSNFAGAAIYNGKIYVFPKFRNSIFKIDFDGIVIEEKLCPELNYFFDKEEELPHMLFSCSCQIKNHIWLFTENQRLIIDYDLTQEKFEKYMLSESIGSCIRAVYKDKRFYILNYDGKVYKWFPEEKNEQLVYDFRQKKSYSQFRSIIIAGENLWLLPFLGEDIIIFNLRTKDCKVYNDYPADFKYNAPNDWSKYFTYCDNQQYYYFSMHSGNYILVIDKKNGTEHWIKPQANSYIKKILLYLKREKNIPECTIGGIKDYMECLKRKEIIDRKIQYICNGKLIWNSLGGK